MLIVTKHVGETPLELLGRLRAERPELAHETLSYAGRLDPMAEGEMLVLVGAEENSPESREKYLGLDKEYIATFLVGVATDTGDALGLIDKKSLAQSLALAQSAAKISEEEIKRQVEALKSVTTQTYPWFSSRVVAGKKLFEHYKEGNVEIERPTRVVAIREVELLGVQARPASEIKEYIFNAVGKVRGDFRQKETVAGWEDFFDTFPAEAMHTFDARLTVSSGTYIRALTEHFGVPVTLLRLKRTKIILPKEIHN